METTRAPGLLASADRTLLAAGGAGLLTGAATGPVAPVWGNQPGLDTWVARRNLVPAMVAAPVVVALAVMAGLIVAAP